MLLKYKVIQFFILKSKFISFGSRSNLWLLIWCLNTSSVTPSPVLMNKHTEWRILCILKELMSYILNLVQLRKISSSMRWNNALLNNSISITCIIQHISSSNPSKILILGKQLLSCSTRHYYCRWAIYVQISKLFTYY